MDLSDGIAKDLPRLSKASGCGFEIYKSKLPLSYHSTPDQALRDGEDYELLFSMPADQQQKLEAEWKAAFPDLQLSQIGKFTPLDQQTQPPLQGGFDHFNKT